MRVARARCSGDSAARPARRFIVSRGEGTAAGERAAAECAARTFIRSILMGVWLQL